MRVCVVAEYYPRRRDPALGAWAHRQAVAARDAGAEVRVLVLERPLPSAAAARAALRARPGTALGELRAAATQPRRDALDGIEVEYVRFASPPRERSYERWHSWAARPLARALDRLHASAPLDVVHAHYALPAGGAVLPWADRHGVPLVVSVHGGDLLSPLLAGPDALSSTREVLGRASQVVANSRAMLERASELAGSPDRIRVIHPPAQPPPNPSPPKHERPTVATLGNLDPRKGHALVLSALELLAPRLPDLRWVVIGGGRLDDLAAAAAGGDVDVEWTGPLAPADAVAELARCHVMAMPSVDEAFGVAYAEAMLCGLPAIGCAGEPGPEEIAALGEGMLLVPPGEAQALADVVEDALRPERLARLAEAARRTAAEHFTLERCGRLTVETYRDAAAAP
jgi:teichuronic acid biosynthesis glycosyltransferase TuaC